MPRYSVAEAKNTLPSLIARACAGEEVLITRHGKEVAEVKPRETFDRDAWLASLDRLKAARDRQPISAIDSAQLIREMRDESW